MKWLLVPASALLALTACSGAQNSEAVHALAKYYGSCVDTSGASAHYISQGVWTVTLSDGAQFDLDDPKTPDIVTPANPQAHTDVDNCQP